MLQFVVVVTVTVAVVAVAAGGGGVGGSDARHGDKSSPPGNPRDAAKALPKTAGDVGTRPSSPAGVAGDANSGCGADLDRTRLRQNSTASRNCPCSVLSSVMRVIRAVFSADIFSP